MRRSLRSLRPRRYGNSSGGQAHSRLARLGLCRFWSGWGGQSPDRHCRRHRPGEAESRVGAGPGGEHGCSVPIAVEARVRGKAGVVGQRSPRDAENNDSEQGTGKDPMPRPRAARLHLLCAGWPGRSSVSALSSPTCAELGPRVVICLLVGHGHCLETGEGGRAWWVEEGDVGRHSLIPGPRADFLSAGLAGM